MRAPNDELAINLAIQAIYSSFPPHPQSPGLRFGQRWHLISPGCVTADFFRIQSISWSASLIISRLDKPIINKPAGCTPPHDHLERTLDRIWNYANQHQDNYIGPKKPQSDQD
jgi:hypothetical protein